VQTETSIFDVTVTLTEETTSVTTYSFIVIYAFNAAAMAESSAAKKAASAAATAWVYVVRLAWIAPEINAANDEELRTAAFSAAKIAASYV